MFPIYISFEYVIYFRHFVQCVSLTEPRGNYYCFYFFGGWGVTGLSFFSSRNKSWLRSNWIQRTERILRFNRLLCLSKITGAHHVDSTDTKSVFLPFSEIPHIDRIVRYGTGHRLPNVQRVFTSLDAVLWIKAKAWLTLTMESMQHEQQLLLKATSILLGHEFVFLMNDSTQIYQVRINENYWTTVSMFFTFQFYKLMFYGLSNHRPNTPQWTDAHLPQ